MVKIQLPKLRQPELPNVSATVVDTFYRPQVRPINPALKDLAASVSNLVPSLRRYDILKEEQFKETEQDRAEADFLKNKNAFKELVKNKTIPEGASPYYINALAKNQLKQDAREFKEQLFEEWNANNVWRSDDPMDFDKFYKSFSEKFYQNKKLGSYGDATIAEAFIPDANAAYNELAQRNREKRIVEIENTQKDLLSKETFSLLDDSLTIDNLQLDKALADVPNAKNLDEQEKRTLYTSLALQTTLDNLIANHMNPRVANEVVVDTVISYAKLAKDEEYLDVLANIVTDKNSGSRLADTDYAFEKINSALVTIERDKQSDLLFRQGQEDRARKEKRLDIQNNFYKYFLQNPENILNIQPFIEQQILAGVEIDAQNYSDIKALQESYINNLNSENVIVDKQVYKDLLVDINTNPDDETLFEQLVDALDDGKIDTGTFDKLFGALQSASDPSNSLYFGDSRWALSVEGLGSVVNNFYSGAIESSDGELLNNAEIRLYEVAYDLVAEIAADESLSSLTPKKRKDYFFAELEKEVNRLKNFLRSDFDESLLPEVQETVDAIRNPID
jgi:hypothetical protein